MIEINLIAKKAGFKAPIVLGVNLAEVKWKPIVFSLILYNYIPGYLEEQWGEKRKSIEDDVLKLVTKNRKIKKELQRNQNIKDKLVAYNRQIKRLKERSAFVDKIIKRRTNPRHVLEKVARSAPDNVWLEDLFIGENKKITVTGGSVDYKSIGDFIAEANESPFFGKSLQLGDSKTKREKKSGVEVRTETFRITGDIKVFDPYIQ